MATKAEITKRLENERLTKKERTSLIKDLRQLNRTQTSAGSGGGKPPAKVGSTAVAKAPKGGALVPYKAGRTLLGTLFARASIPAFMATLGYQAYEAKKKTNASQAQYESAARKIAKDSMKILRKPSEQNKEGRVVLAGEKVKVSDRALKKLKTIEVKDRVMDNPAKAKEPGDGKVNYNVGVSKGGVPFAKAFAHFRAKGVKEFTWNGKRYHTRTKEEEAARKNKSAAKGVRRSKSRKRKPSGK